MTLEEKLNQLKKDTYSRQLNKALTPNLTDSDVCPICQGAEWIIELVDGVETAAPCTCRERNMIKRRMSFAEIPDGFKDMRLKTFRADVYQEPESRKKIKIACRIVKEYLDMFEDAKRNGMGLYICSSARGSGKTRMAASIANELIEHHDTAVKFSTSTKILSEIRRTYNPGSVMTESQLLDALVTAEVLVIDDFGTEKVTGWVQDKFYEIVNSRYVDKKVTLFTSNESLDMLSYDERITNRIKEMCYQVDFPEESVREYIAERNMAEMMGKVFGGRNNGNDSKHPSC